MKRSTKAEQRAYCTAHGLTSHTPAQLQWAKNKLEAVSREKRERREFQPKPINVVSKRRGFSPKPITCSFDKPRKKVAKRSRKGN